MASVEPSISMARTSPLAASKVAAAATAPMASMRKPLSQAFLPEEHAKQGADHKERGAGDRSGDDEAVAGAKEERNERQARADGEGYKGRQGGADRRAEVVRVQPKLLAGERIERLFGVGTEMGGDVAGYAIGMPRAA
jgi:hypothetical protein